MPAQAGVVEEGQGDCSIELCIPEGGGPSAAAPPRVGGGAEEAWIRAAVWMNLERIIPSKRSQMQNTTYYIIPSIGIVQNRQIHRDRDQWE